MNIDDILGLDIDKIVFSLSQIFMKKESKPCIDVFRDAYNNRYTWESDFKGYSGDVIWSDGSRKTMGSFSIDAEFKTCIKNISDDTTSNLIKHLLWEVCIHRVRRDFVKVHCDNSFSFGNYDECGQEIIVDGKNKGDRYWVKNNVINVVHRNIHGKLIVINTSKILETDRGYLSLEYVSQYFDPISNKPITGEMLYRDKFSVLDKVNFLVLSNREIEYSPFIDTSRSVHKYDFFNMTQIIN